MPEQINHSAAGQQLKSTELAFERTVLSHERTLMAWIRTATSMITFGFSLYKFFDEMTRADDAKQRLLTPRIAGMLMIAFGFTALLLAQVQYKVATRKLRKEYPHIPFSISSMLAVLILIFALLLFLGVLFRQ